MRTATSRRNDAFWISRPSQIRALESPTRQEIVDALAVLGPSSIADLAGHLGRAADSLYFHVRRLVKVGIVRELEPRGQGRHQAAVYTLPGHSVRIRYDRKAGESIRRVIAGALRLSLREFGRAFKHTKARLTGERRNLWGARLKGWLNDDDVAEVNALLERLAQIMLRGPSGEGRTLHSLAWVLSPAQNREKRPRAKARKRKKPQASRNHANPGDGG